MRLKCQEKMSRTIVQIMQIITMQCVNGLLVTFILNKTLTFLFISFNRLPLIKTTESENIAKVEQPPTVRNINRKMTSF